MKQIGKSDNIVLLIDIHCILLSYILTAFLMKGILNPGFLSSIYGKSLIIVIFSYIIIYKYCRRNTVNICKLGYYREFVLVIKNFGTMALILMSYLFITEQSFQFSRLYFITFHLLGVLITYIVRNYLKLAMLLGYKKSNASNKLFVITLSDRARPLIQRMQTEYAWMSQVTAMAILDCDMVGSKINGIEVKGNKENLIAVIKNEVIDEVFIELPYEYQMNMENMLLDFEKMGIMVHINMDIFNHLKMQEKLIGNYMGFQVITYATQIFDERQIFLKRIIDIIGGMVGIVLLFPIFIIFAPLIKVESKGPVFFTQIRVGKNGRCFQIYKFRSMYSDAEAKKKDLLKQNEMNGLMFKMNDDPRVTKIGRFIRKVSIDEFPQFINVLKGDMSLVGTRPPTVDEFRQYETFHRRRLSIKPGITGLWQTSGRSSITDFEDVVKLDLEYIDHWSILLDVKILLKTVYVVLFHKGAI